MKYKTHFIIASSILIAALGAWGMYVFSTERISKQQAIFLDEESVGTLLDLPPDPQESGWEQTAGPLGGTVLRMVPHDGTVWASLYSGGVYELEKDGAWRQIAIGHGIPENRAFDIVADPRDPNTVYVPEMVACMGKTTNGGARWTGLCDTMLDDIGAFNFSTHTLALEPKDPGTLFVPGHTQDHTSMFLVSPDGGSSWEKRFVFDEPFDFNHLISFASKLYLGTANNGVLVSPDNGKHWTAVNRGLDALTTARFVPFNNELYLLGATLQFNMRDGGALYRLARDRSSWEAVRGIEGATGLATDGETLFVGTVDGRVWSSADGVQFRSAASRGLPKEWVAEIVNTDDALYVGVGSSGVFVSYDHGENFEELNAGMRSIATRDVHVNPRNEHELYVGTWDRPGFSWSKNGGKTYTRLLTNEFVAVLQPDPHNFSRVYLGGNAWFVGDVSQGGSRFVEKTKPGKEGSVIKAIAIDPNDSEHILVGIGDEVAETPRGEGLWESRDGGERWERSEGFGDFAVYSILFHPNDARVVYASALGSGVWKSMDGGRRFTQIGGDALRYTYRLAMSPSDPNILVASSSLFFAQLSDEEQTSGRYGGLFQSMDGGVTWKDLIAGIRQYGEDQPEQFLGWLYNFGHMPNYEMVLIDPKDPRHLIVGHHGENVVVTRDGGATWEKQGAEQMVPGNIHNYAYCLGASARFDTVYACTCGRGLFRGVADDGGDIAWNFMNTAYAKESEQGFAPRNAEEARRFILSGAYNHRH